MQRLHLPIGVIAICLMQAQSGFARDVQLRPGFGDEDGCNTSSTTTTTRQVQTSNLSPEARLQRLERILDSQGLVDMLLRLDNLQNEIQTLRGELELHAHQLEEIKQRQRDLYVDIDRRLLRLERNGPVATDTPVVPATPTPKQTSQAPATGSAQAASTPGSLADEQKLYQAAFDLLRELRYEQAVKGFRVFLQKYPQGRYAHIAQYWIGEANYAQRNFKQAITDYEKLISDYPSSPKLAEAMLKVGYSQYELKSYKQAEQTLNRLIKTYPGTTEASQASNLIKKIRLKHAG